ncbi:hypothetical protein Xind_03097 [Xenorhabdus indica]|nr:hypothetical protein [Xenorhabdus indica]
MKPVEHMLGFRVQINFHGEVSDKNMLNCSFYRRLNKVPHTNEMAALTLLAIY